MSEQELDRHVRHRLAVLRHAEEVTGNVAMTSHYFGISRQTFYKWQQRYRADGEQGLRPRSRRPHTCPHATQVEVVGKILYLRQHYYFGPEKIAMYLARYHDLKVSTSGVWRILKRLDLNRLPASQRYTRHDKRWQRYEKQIPGHQVQIDVKSIEPLNATTRRTTRTTRTAATPPASRRRQKYYQFTAIDDCTRLRVLRIYPALNQKTAIQSLDYVLERMPFPLQVIQTDIQAWWRLEGSRIVRPAV